MGIAVSIIVIKVGGEILRDSFHGLNDGSIQIEGLSEIKELKELIVNLEEILHINEDYNL